MYTGQRVGIWRLANFPSNQITKYIGDSVVTDPEHGTQCPSIQTVTSASSLLGPMRARLRRV